MEPNIRESIWAKYKEIVEANKEKRKYLGDWKEDEPNEIIYDESLANDTDEDGNPLNIPWQYCNLLSLQWVKDLLEMDFNTINTLMISRCCELVEVDSHFYYRESDILKVLDVLQTLAKTTFVNVLRPMPQNITGVPNPVYTNKDLMNMLSMNQNTLQYYREEGYLGFFKSRGKILYKQEDVDNFLNHPEFRHNPWK